MKDEIYYGRIKYLSFVLLDFLLLLTSNYLAFQVYIFQYKPENEYTLNKHIFVVIIMAVIDFFITAVFNTLERVLRRRKKKELYEGIKHVGYSYITLAVILFLFRKSTDYSRLTITLAYLIYFVLFIGVDVTDVEVEHFIERLRVFLRNRFRVCRQIIRGGFVE